MIGDGFGEFVATNDGDAVKGASGTGVDVVRSTTPTHVRDVGQVSEGKVAIGRSCSSTGESSVTVVVVPGTEATSWCVEAVWVCAGRRDNHVLH